MTNREKLYWLIIIPIATIMWFLGVWSFYVCDVKGFCFADIAERPVAEETEQAVVSTERSSITIAQSASVINAIASSDSSIDDPFIFEERNNKNTEIIPVAERATRYSF